MVIPERLADLASELNPFQRIIAETLVTIRYVTAMPGWEMEREGDRIYERGYGYSRQVTVLPPRSTFNTVSVT